jgi:hypothetical protein
MWFITIWGISIAVIIIPIQKKKKKSNPFQQLLNLISKILKSFT